MWYNVRCRCLFVTLYCCIEYNVIIDCNGQANVLVSAIKMQASFCSHGQTCVCVSECGFVSVWTHSAEWQLYILETSWKCIFPLCTPPQEYNPWRNSKFFSWSLNTPYRIHYVVYRWYPILDSVNTNISQGVVNSQTHHLFCHKIASKGLDKVGRPHVSLQKVNIAQNKINTANNWNKKAK